MQLNNERSRGVILDNSDVAYGAIAGALNIGLLIGTSYMVIRCFTYRWL